MLRKNNIFYIFIFAVLISGIIYSGFFLLEYFNQNKILKEIISRLEADSRIAQVVVTDVFFDKKTEKQFTTIKFLEYNTEGLPLEPKYFTFSGNIIQFQSLVVRFKDIYIREADKLRGKSVYLFWKVFMLDGENTEEYQITHINKVPEGYKIQKQTTKFEEKLWENFWKYSFDKTKSDNLGIKNVQIEAPGSKFIPGIIYTIKIEHAGGMRIDTELIPDILRGEKIL